VARGSTKYLGLGSYGEWDEDKRVEFLVKELSGKRPLIPPDMPASEVLLLSVFFGMGEKPLISFLLAPHSPSVRCSLPSGWLPPSAPNLSAPTVLSSRRLRPHLLTDIGAVQ